jgi:hypothetical protein
LEDEDGWSAARAWIAAALALMAVCKDCMLAASVSKVVLKSSPMWCWRRPVVIGRRLVVEKKIERTRITEIVIPGCQRRQALG